MRPEDSQPATFRTFIGIRVRGSQNLPVLLEDLSKLGRAVRPVPERNLHLTLRFLGSTSEDHVAAIVSALVAAVANIDPFHFRLRGLGAFPNERRPSIVWTGVEDEGRTGHLVQCFSPALDALGFPADGKPWHPHVTVARVKQRPPGSLLRIIQGHRHEPFGTVKADHVDLLRSELRPQGPDYSTVASIALGKKASG